MAKVLALALCPSPRDAPLWEEVLLREGMDARVVAVVDAGSFHREFEARDDFDLVLLDAEAAGCWDVFQEARRADSPVVLIASSRQREDALRYLRTGAADYIHREELWRLGILAQRIVFQAPRGRALTVAAEEQLQRFDHATMEALGGALRRLSAAGSIDKVAQVVVQALRRLLQADGVAFFHLKGRHCHCVAEDADAPRWKGQRFGVNQSVVAWCLKQQATALVDDAYADKRLPAVVRKSKPPRGLAMAPVLGDGLIGALATYWHESGRATEEQLGLVQVLANAAGTVIESMIAQGDLGRIVQERTRVLQEVNEDLETFAYTISHDLKTPLSVIKTSTWTLKENCGPYLDERGRKCLDRLDAAADRIHAQIEGMLAMYHLTRGVVEPEEVDLTAMAKEVVEAMREAEPWRHVDFLIEEGLSAYGDPTLLRVVLENLFANAWKYTSKLLLATVEFAKQERNGQRVFYVRDNGVGFDKACAGRLFTVFQRLHADAEFTGTGVGLASVKRIINKHGGRVWAEGEINRGASFFFSLPAAETTPPGE